VNFVIHKDMRKTLVLGASLNPARYSHMAIERLRQHGHDVIAVGRETGTVAGVDIQREFPNDIGVDTITLGFVTQTNHL
jgi:predicted CoA-binding protein